MVQNVTLAVRLKITDNEAFSALEALHAKMGFVDVVAGLIRETLWYLDVEAATHEAALGIVEDAISRTNVFLNPNKHHYSFAPADSVGADLDPDEVAVVVTDREGADSPRALAGDGGRSSVGMQGPSPKTDAEQHRHLAMASPPIPRARMWTGKNRVPRPESITL